MNNSKKVAALAAGRISAENVLAWLDSGGRDQMQEALKKALEQTEARNKQRELEPDFLDRRVTF
ncbi:MAG: hypothetical protein OEV08_14775 [Nitrospira sp.]|nr:hypothetical protein [Nitrospira sp.]